MDTLSKAARSERMSRVRGKDTKPEMFVRRLVHALGYRYRLHAKALPGTPDLVFPARRKVLFVHGCFWHRHGARCALTRLPKSRIEFWASKLDANRRRDDKHRRSLRSKGWKVLIVWECQLKDTAALQHRISEFLEHE